MFESLFSKFRKQLSRPERTGQELETEFDRLKIQYANLASSDVYQLIKEYFLAKIEINRDLFEVKNISNEADKALLGNAQAEIRVMRDFIADIEGMKGQLEIEQIQKESL